MASLELKDYKWSPRKGFYWCSSFNYLEIDAIRDVTIYGHEVSYRSHGITTTLSRIIAI